MSKMSRGLTIILAFLMVFIYSFPADTVVAEERGESGVIVASGTCGENLTWELDGEGTLSITGVGGMIDCNSDVLSPWVDYKTSIYDVVIGEGVTSIGTNAFEGCNSLVSVTIPGSVVSLGDNLFSHKDPLTIVYTPKGSYTALNPPDNCEIRYIANEIVSSGTCGKNLTWKLNNAGVLTISGTGEMYDYNGNGAPWDFSKINTVIIEYGVTSIGQCAFSGNNNGSITSVIIPVTVTSIGQAAFEGCSSLSDIVIPDSVTNIGGAAFSGTGLTNIPDLNGITRLSDGMFSGCNNFTSIAIPDGIVSIGSGAFAYCNNLHCVCFSSGLKSIENCAFDHCLQLESISLPDGITKICDGAFQFCESLNSVIVPESVTNIGNGVFYECTGLTDIILPLVNWDVSKSSSYVGYLVGNSNYADNFKNITIKGSTFDYIPDQTFAGCHNAEQITLIGSFNKIGDGAFSSCQSLTSIAIPEDVTYIGDSAFWGCYSLTRVVIPEGVISIGSKAFYCENLTEILIPETVESIGSRIITGYEGTNVYVVKDSYADYWLNQHGYTAMIKYVSHIGKHYYIESIIKESTCNDNGTKEMRCVICDDQYTDTIPAVGHDWDDGTVTTDSTCTESGIMTYTCKNDSSHTRTETIPALGHDWDTENVSWKWADDYSSAEAVITCNRDPSHVETVEATVSSETVYGIITYTATATFEGTTYSDTKTVDAHSIIRVFGKSRYLTAIAAANHLKEKKGSTAFDNIIIASGSGFPDALSASYLAYRKDAPILLIHSSVMTMVTDYINANLASGGTVYIVGGEGVVSPEVEQLINGTVKRLAGKDRYETNIKVLEEAGLEFNDSENVLVACGTNFADALSASAVGEPILLVGKELNAKQEAFLKSLLPGEGETGFQNYEFSIIGGSGAVPEKVESQLKALGSVERVYGSNRYQTSIAVAERFFEGDQDTVVIANGNNFPDGLSGGPVATAYGAPLILLVDKVNDHAVQYFKDKNAYRLIIMGGEGVISNETAEKVFGGTV